MGTWQVRITRRDGSQHRCTEHKGRAPQRHEIIETTDDAGRKLRARIEGFSRTPPKMAGLGIWGIDALEI
jgi:hypothetical protein